MTGAGSLEAAGPTRVDVVVTTEPGPGARGRTFVAARAVPLLALAGAGHSDSASLSGLPTYVATLALNRAQALRLIDAESFARAVRLIEI